ARPCGSGPSSCVAKGPSEVAFSQADGVAGVSRRGGGEAILVFGGLSGAADVNVMLVGAVGEALGGGDRVEHRQAAGEGVLAGLLHLAQDVERPEGQYLDAHVR